MIRQGAKEEFKIPTDEPGAKRAKSGSSCFSVTTVQVGIRNFALAATT